MHMSFTKYFVLLSLFVGSAAFATPVSKLPPDQARLRFSLERPADKSPIRDSVRSYLDRLERETVVTSACHATSKIESVHELTTEYGYATGYIEIQSTCLQAAIQLMKFIEFEIWHDGSPMFLISLPPMPGGVTGSN